MFTSVPHCSALPLCRHRSLHNTTRNKHAQSQSFHNYKRSVKIIQTLFIIKLLFFLLKHQQEENSNRSITCLITMEGWGWVRSILWMVKTWATAQKTQINARAAAGPAPGPAPGLAFHTTTNCGASAFCEQHLQQQNNIRNTETICWQTKLSASG